MITVLGATGRVGGRVTALLRERGETVRAVARSAGRLAGPGVEPWAGEHTDVALLTAACTGADAVFVMTPADEGAVDHAAAHAARVDAIAAAVAAARVPYSVALSSLGADLAAGTGFVAGLHLLEQRLGAAAD
ncbi:MAG: NAD(P)H-binding protein, partial [Pseudonocardiales bacterium]|nr:NAD(P)H-binding protein [Pseudonocardiales bacterium]